MEDMKRSYIVNEENKKVAVQIDIETFNRIEEVLENYALFNLMKENNDDDVLEIESAKLFYSQLDKSNWKLNIEKSF